MENWTEENQTILESKLNQHTCPVLMLQYWPLPNLVGINRNRHENALGSSYGLHFGGFSASSLPTFHGTTVQLARELASFC